MQLEDIGWGEALEDQLDEFRQRWSDAVAGRVAKTESGSVSLWTHNGVVHAKLPSRLKLPATRPAVGDWVVATKVRRDLRVMQLFERKTVFMRRAAGRKIEKQVIAANIDLVFIVCGLDGDFNQRRIERYLTAVSDGGARAVILLTKAGGCDDVDGAIEQARTAAPGVRVEAVDVIDGVNDDVGDRYLAPATTVALVGSSGVGKSTLLNHWAGERRQEVGEVRDRDNRGQHTTTRRELFELSSGALVIDTPGMRELALWADEAAVDQAFPDIEALATMCRFSDCRHLKEPGCAVVAAMDDGTLESERLASFRTLREEAAEAWTNMDPVERKDRDRRLSKTIRTALRSKRR